MKFYKPLFCLFVICCLPQLSYAYEAGDWIVRAGAANADPDDSSGLINLAGGDLPGTSVSVGDDTQLGLSLTYMLNPSFGVELLASSPFEHDITEQGVGVGSVGSATHLPPTLSAQYYPMAAESAFQPYFGVGVNYTIFFDEKLSSEFEGALGKSDMELDDSVGLALQIGADIVLSDQWALNATVWKIDLDTEAVINTAAGKVKVDVEIDPWVYMLGLAYRF